MKFLITGGAGFIGGQLVRYLIQHTKNKIKNIDKLTYASSLDSLNSIKHSPRYSLEKTDICNFTNLRKIFKIYRPDVVVHFAAETHVDRSIDSPLNFIKSNIYGTFNLLEQSRHYYLSLSRKKKKIFRFLHVSTDEVYGDLKSPSNFFNEKTSYNPSSPYSASKASSDHLVRAWGKTYGLPILVTNCSNNYGPYQFPEELIPHTIINAIIGNKLPVYGDGSQIRDWLHVEDHVNGILKVIKKGKVGETYNIGCNNEKKNIEVVRTICNILDKEIFKKPRNIASFKDLIYFVKDRPGHDRRYAINAKKIKKQLNWRPKVSFEEGIKSTVIWYLNNKKWWKKIMKKNKYNLKRLGLLK